jgi:hypothetical protein
MVREVSYKVTEKSIEPANKQWLGMQREDCATKVLFDVSKIPSYSDYKWRIDFDQASAGYSPGTSIGNSGSKISRDLPYNMTRFGGDVQITVVGSSEDGEIVYSIPAKGYLTAVSQSEPSENETAIDISSAEISAKKSADAAAESEEKAKASEERSAEYEATAQTAKTAAEEMIKSFEEETEFVFLGGDARNTANTDLVVDNIITPYTKNPVEGRVIYNYINDVIYPVGSIYTSSVNTNPSKLFGGTWELINKGFKNESGTYTFDKQKPNADRLYFDGLKTTGNSNVLHKLMIYYTRTSQVVRFRILLFVKAGVEFADSNELEMANLYYPDFGFDSPYTQFTNITAFTDASNGNGLLLQLETSDYSVQLKQTDIINCSRSSFVYNNPNSNFVVDLTIPIEHSKMIDDFCDKFYWKRIS